MYRIWIWTDTWFHSLSLIFNSIEICIGLHQSRPVQSKVSSRPSDDNSNWTKSKSWYSVLHPVYRYGQNTNRVRKRNSAGVGRSWTKYQKCWQLNGFLCSFRFVLLEYIPTECSPMILLSAVISIFANSDPDHLITQSGNLYKFIWVRKKFQNLDQLI